MLDAYRTGGWGMLPTTVLGVLLMVAAILYALRPERRRVPLLLCLSLLTLLSGLMGFVSGFIGTLAVASSGELAEPASTVVMRGTYQSLYTVSQSLVFLLLALIVIADGALKIWRGKAGEPHPGATR